jgi:hypothetical protein
MARTIMTSSTTAAAVVTAPRAKGRMVPLRKLKKPVRKPKNTSTAAAMENRVLTPLSFPRVSPTFPFSARSMEMASLRGMNRCIPREWMNRKTSMVP